MKYLLGVDMGSTALKACIFDEDGILYSQAIRSTPVISCKDRQERDMNELKRAVFGVIRRCIDDLTVMRRILYVSVVRVTARGFIRLIKTKK